MVAGRIFIAEDVDIAIVNLSRIEKVFAGSEANGRGVFYEVYQEQLTLGPALGNADQQPMSVIGELHVGPILGIAALSENQRILCRIGSQEVIEDVAIVELLSRRQFSRVRIAGVIKT